MAEMHATVLRLALALRRHVDWDVPEIVSFLRSHVDGIDVFGLQREHDRFPRVHREDLLIREEAHRGVPAFPEHSELVSLPLSQHEVLDRVQVVRSQGREVVDVLEAVPCEVVRDLVDRAGPGLLHR